MLPGPSQPTHLYQVTCTWCQNLLVSFCLSLMEGILWPTGEIPWSTYKARSAKKLVPPEWCSTWQDPTWGCLSCLLWSICSLIPLTKVKWLSYFHCLTILFPHCASREYPNKLLAPKSWSEVHFGGNLNSYTSLFLLTLPSSCCLGSVCSTILLWRWPCLRNSAASTLPYTSPPLLQVTIAVLFCFVATQGIESMEL